jgi:hypothetical protein
MIIDATDFIQRPYKVPNQPEARDFVSIIESLEQTLADGTILDECCSLLGVDLWSAFEAGLASSGTVEQHWLDLKNGADYQYAGKTYKLLSSLRTLVLSRTVRRRKASCSTTTTRSL